jgi:hypothetical protein
MVGKICAVGSETVIGDEVRPGSGRRQQAVGDVDGELQRVLLRLVVSSVQSDRSCLR